MDYETTQQEAKVIQALNDLLDKNMSDFDATISDMTAEEIAEIDEITSTREIYSFLRYDYEFEPRAAELLLRMENPLEFLVDNFPCYNLVELATKALADGAVENAGKEVTAKQGTAATTPEQKQGLSSEVQATLQMLVKTDLNLYGEVMGDTLEAIQTQGFVLRDGILQKAESAQVESARHEPETAAVRGKPSVRGQLREAAREVSQRPPTAEKAKGGEAR